MEVITEMIKAMDEMEVDEIVKTVGKAIVTVYDYLSSRNPEDATRMINGLRVWLNDEALWKKEMKQEKKEMYS